MLILVIFMFCLTGIDITVLAFGHPYESYVQVNGGTRNVTGQGIAIVMKATTPNGLVFLMTSEVNTSNDLVALHLTEGRLDFRINLGSDRVKIVSPEAIPSCVWITVELRSVMSKLLRSYMYALVHYRLHYVTPIFESTYLQTVAKV